MNLKNLFYNLKEYLITDKNELLKLIETKSKTPENILFIDNIYLMDNIRFNAGDLNNEDKELINKFLYLTSYEEEIYGYFYKIKSKNKLYILEKKSKYFINLNNWGFKYKNKIYNYEQVPIEQFEQFGLNNEMFKRFKSCDYYFKDNITEIFMKGKEFDYIKINENIKISNFNHNIMKLKNYKDIYFNNERSAICKYKNNFVKYFKIRINKNELIFLYLNNTITQIDLINSLNIKNTQKMKKVKYTINNGDLYIYIYLDFIEGNTLQSIIEKYNNKEINKITGLNKISIIKDILNKFYKMSIYYWDIGPQNIIVKNKIINKECIIEDFYLIDLTSIRTVICLNTDSNNDLYVLYYYYTVLNNIDIKNTITNNYKKKLKHLCNTIYKELIKYLATLAPMATPK
jgi:hypothetical protein